MFGRGTRNMNLFKFSFIKLRINRNFEDYSIFERRTMERATILICFQFLEFINFSTPPVYEIQINFI